MRGGVYIVGVFGSMEALQKEIGAQKGKKTNSAFYGKGEKAGFRLILLEVDEEDPARKLLELLGVDFSREGADVLYSAVKMGVAEPESVLEVTKRLYPVLARQSQSTAGRIERSIRTTIERSWPKAGEQSRSQIFGNYYAGNGQGAAGRPTNSVYIRRTAEYLRRMMTEE